MHQHIRRSVTKSLPYLVTQKPLRAETNQLFACILKVRRETALKLSLHVMEQVEQWKTIFNY